MYNTIQENIVEHMIQDSLYALFRTSEMSPICLRLKEMLPFLKNANWTQDSCISLTSLRKYQIGNNVFVFSKQWYEIWRNNNQFGKSTYC